MTTAEKRAIEDYIISADSSIGRADAFAEVFGLTDRKARRLVFDAGFPSSLLQNLYETELQINREGKVSQEKYVENPGRYEHNINTRIDQSSMNIGSRRTVITEKQQLNDILNFQSPRQKDKEIAQEKLTEKQRQAIQSDILKSENLNTIYDIGALDWGRRPINDIYNRNPFETYKTSQKYDAQAYPQSYMKIDAPKGVTNKLK
ncbi:MAG: hypothetical protein EZS28_013530 [Streblomastix strix]|uniref:Uncharacterized protein n=1 Tax=Streblomastix strix TaxID=222440 RepID=A0A5J4W8W3_9EUKA|nr:MAG: hypothetical protein EZS28_013530 [Streblomastix strix]